MLSFISITFSDKKSHNKTLSLWEMLLWNTYLRKRSGNRKQIRHKATIIQKLNISLNFYKRNTNFLI